MPTPVPDRPARSLCRAMVRGIRLGDGIGRSWLPESFPAFDLRVTDCLVQSKAPYDVNGRPVDTAPFGTDLVELCSETSEARIGRRLFCFRGFALADLAVARLALQMARDRGLVNRPHSQRLAHQSA